MSHFAPGDECEIAGGFLKGTRVRLYCKAGISEIGVQLWIADWPGARRVVVREDFLRRIDK